MRRKNLKQPTDDYATNYLLFMFVQLYDASKLVTENPDNTIHRLRLEETVKSAQRVFDFDRLRVSCLYGRMPDSD